MFKGVSFQTRMFIFYSLFVILLLVLMSSIFYYYISSLLQSREADVMSQTVKKISASLDSLVDEMDTLSMQVFYSKFLQETMYDAKLDSKYYFDNQVDLPSKVRDELATINSPKDIASRIGIFNLKGDAISVGRTGEDIKIFRNGLKNISWLKSINKSVYRSVLLSPHQDAWIKNSPSSPVVSFIREFVNTRTGNSLIGYIEIQQPYSKIEDICTMDERSDMKLVVVDDKGEIIFPYNELDDKTISYYKNCITESSRNNYKIINKTWNGVNELVLSVNSSLTNWTTLLIQPRKSFMSSVYTLQSIVLLFGLIFLVITLTIMYFITRNLTAPIRKIRMHIKELSLENLSIDLGNQTVNNEVDLLNEALNKTLARLKGSMIETFKAREGELQANFIALQAQMNPHFLYNILMVISSAGYELGSTKIMKICSQLSDMLRYTASSSNSTITIKDELTHAENYIFLLKWRFENLLEYTFDIDEKLYDIEVPKLIIQPLVENSYSHGFSEITPPWKLEIRGYVRDTNWILEISDSGIGFSAKAVENINLKKSSFKESYKSGNLIKDLDIGGMGIINIYMRMILFYGENAVFDIRSNSGEGATVILGGPLNHKRGMNL